MATPTARTAPVVRVPMLRVYLLALIELATLGALVTPLVVSLSLKVLELVPQTQKEGALGLVTASGALAALLANPIFGHLSDRTRSRFGRRRPWLIGGALGGLGAAVILATAPNLPVLVLGWVLSQAAYNATLAALSGLLADQVPEEQRSQASGIFGAFGFLGMVPAMLVATLFAAHLPLVILAMPVFAVASVTILCLVLPDPPVERAESRHGSLLQVFAAFAFHPGKAKTFTLVWIQRATMQLGYTVVSTFGLFYLMVRLGMDQTAAASLTSMATLAGAALNFVAAFACGYLASRRGNYTPFIVGAAVLMAVSLVLKAFTDSTSVFWVSTLLAGFALGAYYAVDLALAMRTLPRGEEGKFLGIFNVAKTLPQSLAPALAPFLVMIGGADPVSGGDKNYAALYLVAALLVLASLLTLPGLRGVLRRKDHERVSVPESATRAG
ncbi:MULTISPECIES: MFS transporter [Microbacterium]|uniref:MFS transporter n=1 Tax=Microbacterium TaxID=33882 RepID=UPI0030104553